jgi:tripartite-type tricarboxylate transporter receptor subunit TctC
MEIGRRHFLQLAAGATATAPPAARAQAWPVRSVTLIVFVGAGGAPDIIARLIGQGLSPRLGQPVVIENRPGGGGNLALQAVARAPPDGYTLLLVATPHAVNATLYERQNVDVVRDIVPVAGINRDAFVALVSASSPLRTLSNLIADAKANPGKINMASSGTGNMSHLCGELFRQLTGIDMVHVPYKGAVPAQTGLVSGEVHVMFDAVPSALPHVRAGRLRALAVTSATRVEALPDVPAAAEVVPGYEVNAWLGIGAPRGTPADVVERLNRDVNATLADPAVARRFTELGSPTYAGTPGDFGRLLAEDVQKWAKVIRAGNIRPE